MSGGCIDALSVVGASGMLAAAARPLTAVAPANSAADSMKPRRDIMIVLRSTSSMSTRPTFRSIHRSRSFGSRISGAASHDNSLEVAVREPEIAFCFYCGHGRVEPLPRLREQRKHIDLHGAIAQRRFVGDDLPQRQDFALIMRS